MADIEKINVNVATVGHVDHGKTSTSAAISKFCAENFGGTFKDYKDIDNAKEEKARGITICVSTLLVNTLKRTYSLSDCPGHADFMKNTLSGSSSIDAGILLLSVADSLQEQTKAHLKSLVARGVKKIVIFLNKMDLADESLVELTTLELSEMMEMLGYHHVEIPEAFYNDINNFSVDNSHLFTHDQEYEYVVVKGSAVLALNGDQGPYGVPAIRTLVKLWDDFLPDPIRDYEAPFCLYVEQGYSIKGVGTIIAGKVISGKCKKDDQLKLVGLGTDVSGIVVSVEMFKQSIPEAKAGQNVGMRLRFADKVDEIKRGTILCAPNSYQEGKFLKCVAYFGEGVKGAGKNNKEKQTYKSGFEPQFCINSAYITGKIMFTDEHWNVDMNKTVSEGDENVNMFVELNTLLALPIALKESAKFIMTEGNKTVATGFITEVMKNAPAGIIPSK